MSEVVIYHNPRCSKSRTTLTMLEQRGITPRVVRYLETPPGAEALAQVVAKLGIKPWDLLRRKEAVFQTLSLTVDSSDEAIINAMVRHPELIERPIVVTETAAVIGRPPENIDALFD